MPNLLDDLKSAAAKLEGDERAAVLEALRVYETLHFPHWPAQREAIVDYQEALLEQDRDQGTPRWKLAGVAASHAHAIRTALARLDVTLLKVQSKARARLIEFPAAPRPRRS